MKVPPVLQALIGAGLMSALSLLDRQQSQLMMTMAIVLCGVGVGVAVIGVWQFRRRKTTVNPNTPESATQLVTDGIYKYTRNPMYVGMVIVLIGWGLWLGSAAALIVVPLFMLSMTYLQIKKEEKALEQVFGDVYVQYLDRTRRWL